MELSQQRHRGHVRRCGHTANESLDDNDGMRRVPCTSTRCRASRTRHCSRNFDAVFLHNHRVANVDRVEVPLSVLGAESHTAVADILIPE